MWQAARTRFCGVGRAIPAHFPRPGQCFKKSPHSAKAFALTRTCANNIMKWCIYSGNAFRFTPGDRGKIPMRKIRLLLRSLAFALLLAISALVVLGAFGIDSYRVWDHQHGLPREKKGSIDRKSVV